MKQYSFFLAIFFMLTTDWKKDKNISDTTSKDLDVYVAGYESNGTKSVAKIWKNDNTDSYRRLE